MSNAIPAELIDFEKNPPHREDKYLCFFIMTGHDRLINPRPPQSPEEYRAEIEVCFWRRGCMYDFYLDAVAPNYYMYLDQFIKDVCLMQFEKDSAKEKNNVD